MRRLRILFLIASVTDIGGAERMAVGIASHLPRDRFEVWMCATRRIEPAAAALLDQAGVKQARLNRRSKSDVHRFGALAALLRRQRIDVLHSHCFGSNFWGSVIGRACRVPVVIAHEHTWSYEGQPLRRFIDGQIIGRLADRFVAVSSLDAKRMVSIEGVPAEKVLVIPPPYVPRARAGHSDLRAELGIEVSTPLIAVVAVLRPQKALSVVLDGHARVLAVRPDAHLAIAGDGPCRQQLEHRASALGLKGRVHFLGRRNDVDDILATADVAALSSDYEGTPLVAFECMANRTPLVATAVGGLPDVLDHGRSGVLVAPRDPHALADAILTLLADPSRREEIAAAAADRVGDFSIEIATQRFAALYERLAREAGSWPYPATGLAYG